MNIEVRGVSWKERGTKEGVESNAETLGGDV